MLRCFGAVSQCSCEQVESEMKQRSGVREQVEGETEQRSGAHEQDQGAPEQSRGSPKCRKDETERLRSLSLKF